MVAKIQKDLIALVLPGSAITKIDNTFDLGQILLDVKHEYSLQLMNKTGVMFQIIRNDAQCDVISLDFILHHIVDVLPLAV